MEALENHIEAIVFSADRPVKMKDIIEALGKSLESKPSKKNVEKALEALEEKYSSELYAFGLVRISDGFQFLTKSDYHKTVSTYLNVKSKRRLSTAAMETLAIIAYKQPVTKSEMEQIRGVNCDYSVQRLLEKELIEIAGRSPGPGRPLLYATSQSFMDHFALGSIKDLPQLKEIIPEDNVIGVPEIEDDPLPEASSTEGETEAVLDKTADAPIEGSEGVNLQDEVSEASIEIVTDTEEIAEVEIATEEQEEIVAETEEVTEEAKGETLEANVETIAEEQAIEENSLEFPKVVEAEDITIDSETVSETISEEIK